MAFGQLANFVLNRYEKFFFGANDKFEVQRGLNNVFAYDLVPSVRVCEAALRACRRGTVSFSFAMSTVELRIISG